MVVVKGGGGVCSSMECMGRTLGFSLTVAGCGACVRLLGGSVLDLRFSNFSGTIPTSALCAMTALT
jgi:hypothetical protein